MSPRHGSAGLPTALRSMLWTIHRELFVFTARNGTCLLQSPLDISTVISWATRAELVGVLLKMRYV